LTDIKPDNIHYLSRDLESPLVLAGFAHSAILSSPEEVVTDRVGTFGYAAPEAMSNEGHGRPADVWSIGVITYTLLCGYSPFRSENMHDLYEECNQGSIVFHERYWKDVSSDAKDFICQTLIPEAKGRITSKVRLYKECYPFLSDMF
jgi:calcium/calmodulin-dependent protein kinase I